LYYSCVQIEKNEKGGTCSTYGGVERGIQVVGGGNVREGDYMEDPVIDGRIILRWNFRKWDVGTWTGLIWL
jgi:hypothetical protein